MTGGVDELNFAVFPMTGGDRRCNGDAPLLFIRHPVHDSFSVVDFADFMGFAGIIKNALGHGGFAGVDMGDDADITDGIDFMLSHVLQPVVIIKRRILWQQAGDVKEREPHIQTTPKNDLIF